MNINIFKNQLGELYDFSLVKCEIGIGIFLDNNSNRYNVKWALNMDLKGELTFVVLSNQKIHLENKLGFINYDLDGYTEDNIWSVICKNVVLNSEKFNSETGRFMYTGTVNTVEFEKKSNIKERNNNVSLKGLISNFKFHGLEFTQNGDKKVRNKFTSKVLDKSIEFRLKENVKDIYCLIQDKRIESAIMSYLCFDLEPKYKIEELNNFLRNISWFISLITLNTTFIPYIEIFNNKEIVYKKLLGNTLNYKYSENTLIDNFLIKGGIKNIIESNFEQYLSLKEDLELTKSINTLLKIESEPIIEFKLTFLILAYEQITTKFLLMKGKDKKTIKRYNIQQKIQQINSVLRFIPTSHQGDDLRENVRNEIFHLGDLPLLDFKEKVAIFNKYYELLYKILFRIIGYNGKYFSRINYEIIENK